jgi:hypothetical protein
MAEQRINNLKRLMEEEYESRFTLPEMGDFDPIENRLMKHHQTQRFNGDVTDLFLPKMIRSFVSLFGSDTGSSDHDDSEFDRPAPSKYAGRVPQSAPKGPNR